MCYRIIFWDKAVRINLPKQQKSLYFTKKSAIEGAKILSTYYIPFEWKIAVIERFSGKVVYVCV